MGRTPPDRVDEILDFLRGLDPDAPLQEKAVAIRLTRAAHWVDLALRRQLAPLGIDVWELDILATLVRMSEPTPISALQESAQVTPAAITNRVGRLEHHGFVVREVDPADRRQVLVKLTRAGRARAVTVIKANDIAQRETLGHLDLRLLSRLERDLRLLLIALEGPSSASATIDTSDVGGKR